MIALLLMGLALARPTAILGPDGPRWLGPLPPAARATPRPVLLVDPASGALYVEDRDGGALARVWDGELWRRDGVPLVTGEPGPEPTRYTWDPDHLDRLQAVDGADGVRRRYTYTPEGRLSGAIWADGASFVARYDAEGRVVALDGPGPATWRFRWGDTLEVLDDLGRSTRVRVDAPDVDGVRVATVEDALGRTARTWLGPGLDGDEILGWEDARGLRTTVRQVEGALLVDDVAGHTWRIERDPGRRLTRLSTPSGAVWTWSRDPSGRLTGLVDPAGQVTHWERDARGDLSAVVVAGSPTRLVRDEAGRLIAVEGPDGARTTLTRDSLGRLIGVTDPAGDALTLTRGPSGLPASLTTATGARWKIGLDMLGRPSALDGPAGERVGLERDGAGRVTRIRRAQGDLLLAWGHGDALTRVARAAGEAVELLRDAVGRLVGVRRVDGQLVQINRDLAGNVVEVSLGDEAVGVRRDAAGRPIRAGGVAWTWDADGRLSSLSASGAVLGLDRDAAGRLRRVRAGDQVLEVSRDSAGRPIRWSGADGALELRVDAAGQAVSAAGAERWEASRDARGLVSRLASEGADWRWSRDAEGRVLRALGPSDLSLGLDRDEAGRVVLERYPDGALVRRTWSDGVVTETLEDEAGRRSHSAAYVGRADGSLVASEADPCALWTADAAGWTRVAGCAGPVAWGVAQTALSLAYTPEGRVTAVQGEQGQSALGWDAFGRLSAVQTPAGTWTLRYTPRGQVGRVTLPDGAEVSLAWATLPGVWTPTRGGLLGAISQETSLLLRTGRARAWLQGPDGLSGVAEAPWIGSIVRGADGLPISVRWSGVDPVDIATGPTGFPTRAEAGIAGAWGALQPFPGGPLLTAPLGDGYHGPGAAPVDPVSGQRLDQRPWPWAQRPADVRDPSAWAPEVTWGDPVALLGALGALELDPALAAWTTPEVAFSFLPASLDRARPPQGPEPGAWALEDDPVSAAVLRAVLTAQAPDPGFVLRVLLADEVPVPWLPPGTDLLDLR